MKQRFVVDLNVIRFAQTLTDEKGNKTYDSARLLLELVARCHSLVTCTEVYRKYSQLVDGLRTSGATKGLGVFALASTAVSVTNKWLHVAHPPAVKGEERIPEDDIVLVRLAFAHRAHLITADGKLVTAINKTDILTRRSLRVLTVGEALQQVMTE